MSASEQDRSEEPRECSPGKGGRCQSFWPGHNVHWIHANHIGRTPWGWRDGVVRSVESGWIDVDYVLEAGHVRAWYHQKIRKNLRPGAPVRVHEQYHALGSPKGWLNVFLEGGLGPVPDPAEPAVWAAEMTGGVVDLATGQALALDHDRADVQ